MGKSRCRRTASPESENQAPKTNDCVLNLHHRAAPSRHWLACSSIYGRGRSRAGDWKDLWDRTFVLFLGTLTLGALMESKRTVLGGGDPAMPQPELL